MASKKLDTFIREEHMKKAKEYYENLNMDCVQIANNQLAIPVIHEGEEAWLRLTFSIPKGPRGGNPFDGYEEAEHYEDDQIEKEEKRKEKEKAKKKKIKQDTKRRAFMKEKKEKEEKEE